LVLLMNRFEILNQVHTNPVKKIIEENYRVKTIEIDHNMKNALPGQFLMVWIPGIGEKPMSIGNNTPLSISVANVGKVSSKIHELKEGDPISYRGPFGKPFDFPEKGKKLLVIGGGYGVVPLYFLAKMARGSGLEPYAVIGGKSAKDIIFEKPLFAVCEEVFITTDDGSRGKEGTVMAEAKWLIESKKFGCVYACGPERMMKAVAEMCKEHKMPCQLSLERHMKCGVGVCGSCAISGRLTCLEGPVFNGEDALKLSEFGKNKRDASGRLCSI
jgi:dihydroorotate dehydrogenase electron transfer subunit